MPIEIAAPDPLIDALVADLDVVAPRRKGREIVALAALAIAEVGAFAMVRDMRPDMPQAMLTAAFLWKTLSLLLIAGLAGAAALISLDPATTNTPRLARLWSLIGVTVSLALLAGWLIDAGAAGEAALLARLDWRDGLACLADIVLLSLPPLLALALLMRRGAPTQLVRTAYAAGLAGAAFAALVFAFHCDHDDPLYVALWYGGAVAGIALLARTLLPRLARW